MSSEFTKPSACNWRPLGLHHLLGLGVHRGRWLCFLTVPCFSLSTWKAGLLNAASSYICAEYHTWWQSLRVRKASDFFGDLPHGGLQLWRLSSNRNSLLLLFSSVYQNVHVIKCFTILIFFPPVILP